MHLEFDAIDFWDWTKKTKHFKNLNLKTLSIVTFEGCVMDFCEGRERFCTLNNPMNHRFQMIRERSA